MSHYLKEIEETFREMLTHNDPEDVVKWVKERILESYRNGLAKRDSKEQPARTRSVTAPSHE